MRATILTSIGIILTVLGLLFYLSPFAPISTENYDISPGGEMSLTQHWEKSERIEGYFTVKGGNEEVGFYIKDPFGAIIYDGGTVKGRHDFALTAEHSGEYSFTFENEQQSGKVISFCSKTPIIAPYVSLIIAAAGVLFLILGMIDLYQRRLKTRASEARAFFGHPSTEVFSSHMRTCETTCIQSP